MSNKLPISMMVFGPVNTPPAKMQGKRREPVYVHHYHQYVIDTDWYSDPRALGNITDPVQRKQVK